MNRRKSEACCLLHAVEVLLRTSAVCLLCCLSVCVYVCLNVRRKALGQSYTGKAMKRKALDLCKTY